MSFILKVFSFLNVNLSLTWPVTVFQLDWKDWSNYSLLHLSVIFWMLIVTLTLSFIPSAVIFIHRTPFLSNLVKQYSFFSDSLFQTLSLYASLSHNCDFLKFFICMIFFAELFYCCTFSLESSTGNKCGLWLLIWHDMNEDKKIFTSMSWVLLQKEEVEYWERGVLISFEKLPFIIIFFSWEVLSISYTLLLLGNGELWWTITEIYIH